MESSEKFCLKWNDFETNISSAFREIRDDKVCVFLGEKSSTLAMIIDHDH